MISFPIRWFKGHTSHTGRVTRRCDTEQSSYSCRFSCRSFTTHTPWAVCFLMWKKCMFLWAKIGPDFTEHFTCRLCIKTETFWAHVLNSVCWTTSVCELLQIVNFDDFWVLTSLVLANSSDYLKCSEKDSDWFIVAFFIRVVSMLTTLCLLLK